MPSVRDVVAYYLRHLDCRPRSRPTVESQVGHVVREIGALRVADLRAHHLEEYRATRRARVRDSTINRELAYLRAALRRARDDELVERIPRVRLTREENRREGYLSAEELRLVLPHLPHDVRDLVEFLFWSGWRWGAVVRLPWGAIDWSVGMVTLPHELAKSGHGVALPIAGPIRAVLERRRRKRDLGGVISALVFSRNGRPIRDWRWSWRVALERAGLEFVVPHSLRRSAVTHYHTRMGLDAATVMRLCGMRTRSILDRYTITRPETLRLALERAAEY